MSLLEVETNWQTVKKYLREMKAIERRALLASFHADAASQLFDKHPVLDSFAWAQYRDSCGEYRCAIDTDQICVNGLNPITCKWEADSVAAAQEAAALFLLCVGEDALKFIFGPNKFIRVARGKQAETTRYDSETD